MTDEKKTAPAKSFYSLIDFFDDVEETAAAAAKEAADAAAKLVADAKVKKEKEDREKEIGDLVDVRIGKWAEENLEPPASTTTTTTKVEKKA